MPKKRTLSDIQQKLTAGEAVVMTAGELCSAVRAGQDVPFEAVDIVTAATCGLMSGTYAVLSFQFTPPNVFTKAAEVYLNGVPAHPGPCPNERIGLIDAIVHGTAHSRDDARYGGGHLFRDIVAGRPIQVDVRTQGGRWLEGAVKIDDMPHAVLHGSRHAFRNYVGFVNPGDDPVTTIFCSSPLPPRYQGATACGCGEINPLQKDPGLRTVGVGTRVLVNGGDGYVVGLGTRSSPERPNLSVVADMHFMDPQYMGGFQTSAGPEVIQTWAMPIPILDEAVLQTATVTDADIPLSITDIRGRTVLDHGTYADLWQNTAGSFTFDAGACRELRAQCADCPPAVLCPSGAFSRERDRIARRQCFHCGICAATCRGGCFAGELGRVRVAGRDVPFIQRLSDRVTAGAAALDLKKRLVDGRFVPTVPVAPIVLG